MMPTAPGKEPAETVINDSVSIIETWRAMTNLDKKKTRAVGVSNFGVAHVCRPSRWSPRRASLLETN